MMKQLIVLLTAVICCSSCSRDIQQFASKPAPAVTMAFNKNYSKAAALQQLMDTYIKGGVPGLSIAVYSRQEGWWAGAAGFSNIEQQVPMEPGHLQYLQSVTKTYMATAMLKLKEEGRLVLDSPITHYLPARYANYIANSGNITVRMLLNHTSGIAEFADDIESRLWLLQHPEHVMSVTDNLSIVQKHGPHHAPGVQYEYVNTNYDLLALIADSITGNHARYMANIIFKPLGLTQTFYLNDPHYLDQPNMVNSYLDRYGNGIIENVTQLQQSNVASMIGDDGIQASPVEVVKFLKALMEGQIISAASLQEMQTWVNTREGKPVYGMGLFHVESNGQTIIGHGGGGLGAGCEMYYLPAQQTYVFMAMNMGVFVESPLLKQAGNMKEQIVSVLQREGR